VTAGHVPDGVELSVRDHGEGVPSGFVPSLFERYTRAGTGVATRASGTGLGLFIVRSLAEAGGGRIAYEPAGPGSRFTITFPAAPQGATPDPWQLPARA
jgi:signal transduction histidine kinase